jgi:hypothetical protein
MGGVPAVPALLKRVGGTGDLTFEIGQSGDEYCKASPVSAGQHFAFSD